MAINIRHTYSTNVEITFYGEDGIILRCRDCGKMDDIAEQVCEVIIKHNFSYADICSANTGELMMVVERT